MPAWQGAPANSLENKVEDEKEKGTDKVAVRMHFFLPKNGPRPSRHLKTASFLPPCPLLHDCLDADGAAERGLVREPSAGDGARQRDRDA